MKNKGVMSVVFRNLNRLRAIARVQPVFLDMNRLYRALGEVQCNDRELKDEVYFSTEKKCLCADQEYSHSQKRKAANGQHYGGPCKHRIREMLLNPVLDPDKVLIVLIEEASHANV